jgi:hypothetical protein
MLNQSIENKVQNVQLVIHPKMGCWSPNQDSVDVWDADLGFDPPSVAKPLAPKVNKLKTRIHLSTGPFYVFARSSSTLYIICDVCLIRLVYVSLASLFLVCECRQDARFIEAFTRSGYAGATEGHGTLQICASNILDLSKLFVL